MARKRYGCVDRHPIHDTKDIFQIGTCVRVERFVERVGYDKLTNAQEIEIMEYICKLYKIPREDVILCPDGQGIVSDEIMKEGEYIDWEYFPKAVVKFVDSKENFGIGFKIPFDQKDRGVGYLARPTLEEVKERFKNHTRYKYQSGAQRKVFYTPNKRPDDIFVVVGKRIAKTGKYERGGHSCGEYEPPYLYDQESQQIYTVKRGLYGDTLEVHKDDLILMEYAIPATKGEDGREHNWRVNAEWDYEHRRPKRLQRKHDELFGSARVDGDGGNAGTIKL